MSNDRLQYLLEQYAADTSTPQETKELFGWIKRSKDDTLLKEKIKKLWSGHANNKQLPDVDWEAIYIKIINTPVIGKRYVWPRIAAAAVIIVLLSAGSYFIFNNYNVPTAAIKTRQEFKSNDVVPGGNKAVLTLANGAKIILDSAGNGTLTQQGNIKIIKLDNGRLSYNSLNEKPGEVLYNTISTPRGGQYQVVLADGSKVWLNAASSLRFPTSFTAQERNVELTGEGYFEVAHNAAKPFKVFISSVLGKPHGAEIEVIGTHFNVNAYADETTIKTTLLEGSVKVGKGSTSKTIRPGEQAQIENHGNSKIIVQATDVDAAVAWKNGRFIFHGDNIQSVMRQLARWYDVDVNYEGNVIDEEFVGVINRSRYENIADILDILEKTRTLSFTRSGRNITVTPFKK